MLYLLFNLIQFYFDENGFVVNKNLQRFFKKYLWLQIFSCPFKCGSNCKFLGDVGIAPKTRGEILTKERFATAFDIVSFSLEFEFHFFTNKPFFS